MRSSSSSPLHFFFHLPSPLLYRRPSSTAKTCARFLCGLACARVECGASSVVCRVRGLRASNEFEALCEGVVVVSGRAKGSSMRRECWASMCVAGVRGSSVGFVAAGASRADVRLCGGCA
ncbi:hypothetical protein BVRB_007200 [Beta vulgaris subsp. vulgaris]|uniref:Uncharacterized protein n=1 Tax=Beta vulgaris subsp. vulgaris TaxID=3555 RepID=A0A0J8B3I3_BETVV|nr:hypothetical protein BVRB_007200 [Beta vulgaris subsp. vulgaris]